MPASAVAHAAATGSAFGVFSGGRAATNQSLMQAGLVHVAMLTLSKLNALCMPLGSR